MRRTDVRFTVIGGTVGQNEEKRELRGGKMWERRTEEREEKEKKRKDRCMAEIFSLLGAIQSRKSGY